MKRLKRLAHSENRVITLMTLTVIIFFAATVTLFYLIVHKHESLLQSVHEDALWAAYQLDKETQKFLTGVRLLNANSENADIDDLILRYEILYSRIDLIQNGQFKEMFQEQSDTASLVNQMADLVERLEPVMDQFDESDELPSGEQILVIGQRMSYLSENVLMNMIRERAEDRTHQRSDTLRLLKLFGILVCLLALSMLVIIYQLFVKKAEVERRKDEVEILAHDLTEAVAEARKATKAKSDFLAMMSHELRTPLNGIVGMSDLASRASTGEQRQRYIANIKRSGDALLNIVNDILDLSKIEAGKFALYEEVFSLNVVVEDVFFLLRSRVEKKDRVQLEYHFDPELKDRYLGDSGRLRQVLLNLAGNALKFTEKGFVRLEVGLDDDHVMFKVIDTGIGIPEEHQSGLFKLFGQADSNIEKRFGGTGLGLAISKRIVEEMQGEIGFTSKEGEGTTFWFSLPLKAEEGAEEVVATIPELQQSLDMPADIEAQALQLLSILVADDNVINREVVAGLLKHLGVVDILMAENGQEAVEMCEHNRIDLVFMDIQMPVMDGFEASRQIVAMGHGHPVIIGLTANDETRDLSEYHACGMLRRLGKPIQPERLQDLLVELFPMHEFSALETIGEAVNDEMHPAIVTGVDVSDLFQTVGVKPYIEESEFSHVMLLMKREARKELKALRKEWDHGVLTTQDLASCLQRISVFIGGDIEQRIAKLTQLDKDELQQLLNELEWLLAN